MCLRPAGIPADTFVGEYLGELYTPWRWFERQPEQQGEHTAAIAAQELVVRLCSICTKIAQPFCRRTEATCSCRLPPPCPRAAAARQGPAGRRPALRMGASAEFYNGVLERPRADPRGYDVLFVNVSLQEIHWAALPCAMLR